MGLDIDERIVLPQTPPCSQEQYCCQDEAVDNEMGMTALFCFLDIKMEHSTSDPLPMTLCKGGLGSHDELNHGNEENQSDNKEPTTKHTRMLLRPIPLRMPAESLQGKRKERTLNEQDAESIYSSGCLHELTLAIIGCIEIEVPASEVNAFANKQRFYRDIVNSIYHALENACQTAITHLKTKCRVQVDDSNYTKVVALRRKLHAATTFENTFKENTDVNTKYVAALKESNKAWSFPIP